MEFIDLKTQYRRIEQSVQARIHSVLEHGQFILGPEVRECEQKLAAFAGTKHCLTCASGTDALLLPLMAWGIGPGDAVFTTPFTFFATAEVIALVGATPVFVDIDPHTFNIDPERLRAAIRAVAAGTKPASGMPDKLKPAAIIPVDLFGLPADYDSINSVATEFGLHVLEDAAQSFGAQYNGRMAGSLAPVAATSFFPAKPLGCYGDGGAILTDDDRLTAVMESLRVHGKGSDKYDNIRIGINGRFDTLQAAILLSKLELFAEELGLRQKVAARYAGMLDGIVETPRTPDGYRSAWAQYSILTDRRDALMQKLKDAGIPTAIYYPKPLHLQTAFSYLGYRHGDFPVSEETAGRIFSLSFHPYLKEEEQRRIAAVLAS